MIYKQKDVLIYHPKSQKAPSQKTVRRHYLNWRSEQDPMIPLRCDNPKCQFHFGKLKWNGIVLKLILDHINGVNRDNRPVNLRFLCPNCNSQLHTQGGGNKNRVKQADTGFGFIDENGEKRGVLFPNRLIRKIQ